MTAIFSDTLHDCLEDYVDEIVVKFKEVCYHIEDLRRVFTRCWQYNLWMNPLKYAFGVSSKKFMRFTVHRKFIYLDATNAKAIRDMQPLTT